MNSEEISEISKMVIDDCRNEFIRLFLMEMNKMKVLKVGEISIINLMKRNIN
jgi:hypothetical protein